jgi:predicted TIM-barrel fold metal-dependent hydrolase
MKGIKPITERSIATDVKLNLPPGTRLISADNHWEISDDVFYQNFPARLKDKAPRVWFDLIWRIGYKGVLEALPGGEHTVRVVARTTGDGITDRDLRYRDMDAEGVAEEIVFPQTLIGFARYPEFEVQEHIYRIYNEYIAQKFAGPRSHPVAIFSNWWDPAAAERAMRQIVDLGLKALMLPVNPGKSIEGKDIFYGDPVLDRFWEVVAEAGLPVCYHVGEGVDLEAHRGGLGASTMVLVAPFRKPFAQLVFGGVFDRHPNLQVVFAEGGLGWIPPALQDAEAIFDNWQNGDMLDRIEHRPTHYWHNNCHATFQSDALGLSQLHYIGANRVMWASDYPHNEGTFGYGQAAVNAVVSATRADEARAILGGNVAKLFKLNA